MSYVSNALFGVAFHEAGQAIVGRYFGLKPIKVEILADGSGKTDLVGVCGDLPLVDRIAIHCAGQASRTVFRCRSHTIRFSDDETEINRLVNGLTDDQILQVRNDGYRRAITIIKSNASEVKRLAWLLIQQRCLVGNTIDQSSSGGLLPEIKYAPNIASTF